MHTHPTSVRPYLEVHEGELVIELLPGVRFDPDSSRAELARLLRAFTADGRCVASIETDGAAGVTCFRVAAADRAYLLVFADELDRLVTVVPLHAAGRALFGQLLN